MPSWNVHFDTYVTNEDPQVTSLVAECKALATVIRNVPITPRRQKKLDTLNILRAVRGTTGIEGAQLSEEEVRQIMSSPRGKPALPPTRQREELEARNAQRLMHYVARLLARSPGCPMSEQLIRKLHEITTREVDYPANTPGQYRTHAVSAGSYLPPADGNEVRNLMAQFVTWFNQGTPKGWDAVIRALVAHFYVVSIHPFGDGNGRTSRALESFLLYKAGINARGFYSLANYYYQHRIAYVQNLTRVRFETDPDLTPFVLFALQGLAAELREVHREVLLEVRDIAFRDYAREALQDRLATRAGERMLNLVLLLGDGAVPLGDIRQGRHRLAALYRGLTNKTLSRDVNYLSEIQLILSENGAIRANLEIMDRYVPPYDLMQ